MSTISKTISHGVTIGTSGYSSPLTITAAGAVSTTSGYALYEGFGSVASVVNAGTIAAEGGFAIALQDGGSVINQSGGVIGGLDGYGVFANSGALTVVNAGRIAGTDGGGIGVQLGFGGAVTNQAGGTISATLLGIVGYNAGVTVVNAGTIKGGLYAVQLTDNVTDRLVVDPGAVFIGAVSGDNAIGDAAVSTLELASGTARER